MRSGGFAMSTFTLQVQVPEALRDIGYSSEEICRDVPVLLVIKRFREGAISSSKAAHILGLTRREFVDLLGREAIPIYNPTQEQFAAERKAAEQFDEAPGP
jgi:predicted HTH domain antitoxin